MSKASRKAKNNEDKAGRDVVASILTARQPKGVRSLNTYKAYSKLYYASCIKPVVDAKMKVLKLPAGDGGSEGDEEGEKEIEGKDESTQKKPKAKRVTVMKRITREMYETETPEVKAEVAAYVKQINDEKTQLLEAAKELLIDLLMSSPNSSKNFNISLGGPTPVLGGKIDVSSFHVGCTEMGNLFSDTYPNFNGRIMKPWLEFVNRVYPTAAAKASAGGVQGMNELIKIDNDVSVSHGTSDAFTSTLLPPLDESEELRCLADNFLATFGSLLLSS
ncbi:uncharacterized protein HD556DRAFT_1436361 [Suillus plorans]|uniref:Uncharacterized protein n=1 Tax=Suillus plorans TaxID=116603 RepID=A0A9P7DYS2_9AGAM|nr:uncharacterized protein HD556DRAFT_1436361 [Suillus plorans]KAG1806396.1 hypothetical protein HD556DRAFT_1436361 [Suillus plorans]